MRIDIDAIFCIVVISIGVMLLSPACDPDSALPRYRARTSAVNYMQERYHVQLSAQDVYVTDQTTSYLTGGTYRDKTGEHPNTETAYVVIVPGISSVKLHRIICSTRREYCTEAWYLPD